MNLRKFSACLLAATASVLWMAVGSASATTLTSPPNTAYTGTLVAESEGHVVLDNPISTIECASKVEGSVETHGAEITAGGKVSSLSFTNCTNSWHVTVVAPGSLEVHDISGGNGTVTSSGATVEATRFGITCRYATSSTDIGTLTGGSPATLDISAAIPFHSGSGLCGSGATTWTGSYKVTTPSTLTVAVADLNLEITRNGKPVNECKFENEKEKCVLKFTAGKGTKWEVKASKWEEPKAEERYKLIKQGCTAKLELKATESCTDEIEMFKKEAGTKNEWCVLFDELGGPIELWWCTKLSM